LNWCDRNDVKYVVGIARNERLLAEAAELMKAAKQRYDQTKQKQRLFTAFDYAAGKWRRIRWVIAKAEHSEKGSNPRFIVTNIVGDAQKLYDRRYCQRGEMENRVKEQMMLFARSRQRPTAGGATSGGCACRRSPTPLWKRFAGLPYREPNWPQATCASLRATLIKIGAVVVRKATRGTPSPQLVPPAAGSL
jgi:hypothetical protein